MKKYSIIDVHAHIFPEKIREKAVAAIGAFYDIDKMSCKGSAQDLLRYKETAGIDRFVVHSVATVPKQVKSINDFLFEQMTTHPGELIAFATLHPEMDNPEEEIERVISMGFKGIKLHPDFQQVNIDSESSVRIYKLIDGRLPILVHMGDETKTYSKPERLARVAEQFPKQIFIGAHFGGYQAWDESEKYLIGKENVYIDTSSSLFVLTPEYAAELIRRHGAERVLFGTDYPMWDPAEEIERFMRMPLTEEEREMIFAKNLERLLDL